MPRLRPRISLLTAFLLTAAVAVSIVVVRQHGELTAFRKGYQDLPGYWKRRPEIIYDSKLYASQITDIKSLNWNWRVWIPSDATTVLRFKWGDILADGYPNDAISIDIPTGYHWLALEFDEHPASGELLGQLYHPNSVFGFVVSIEERSSPWWKPEYRTAVVGPRTVQETADGRLLLQRFRVAGDDAPADFAAPGFIIWLERH